MVNSTPEFNEHPKVINGYSDLMKDVFGDAGVGTRTLLEWWHFRRVLPSRSRRFFKSRKGSLEAVRVPVCSSYNGRRWVVHF